MKSKIVLSAVMFLLFASASLAQNYSRNHQANGSANKEMNPEEKAKQEASQAQAKLGLSPEQQAKWEQLALNRMNLNKPYREKLNGSTTPEERKDIHSKMKVNADQFDADVNAILTADQKTKWEAFKQEKREKHQGMKEAPVDKKIEE